MPVTFADIQKEFDETLGYVRQDIAALRKADLGLNYTVALLICCACEMLAWHKDGSADEVFTSLLPDEGSYRAIGKSMFEALRNGLAHRFRPETIKIGDDQFRFTLAWKEGPHVSVSNGKPNWLRLNTAVLSERIMEHINAYEKELSESDAARVAFEQHSEKCTKEIPERATRVACGWRSLFNKA